MDILKKCIQVLENNWRDNFTIPSDRLYPFQWNWDSGFSAIGNSYIHPERALIEMETLFSGQWENGFLPHIVFHNSARYSSYFPSADYWESQISDFAPKKVKTSGITQPPVHGFVLERLYGFGLDKKRIESLLRKLIDYHLYLYHYRMYKETGLIKILHNWESGMDNSLWWDAILNKIDKNDVENIALNRKDINEVADSQSTRPKDDDYRKYLFLLKKLKSEKYEKIPENHPFQVICPVFNSILVKSNESIFKLASIFNIEVNELKKWHNSTIKNFDAYLFDNNTNLYFPYDTISATQIKVICSGSFIPIFANIPSKDIAIKMTDKIFEDKNNIPIPSCFLSEQGHEEKNYWRGPVWVNINWMVYQGLLKYKLFKLADKLYENTIDLVQKQGVFEYFNPNKNTDEIRGYGGANFSWTAALIIDMIKTKK
ncbi:MAG TPA: glycoside hydrolase [Bacteroidetes bacterium]|nr:glycoside hydrolase [Bacteroidota bacterium]